MSLSAARFTSVYLATIEDIALSAGSSQELKVQMFTRLQSAGLSSATCKAIVSMVGSFLVWVGLLTREHRQELSEMFSVKRGSWSQKGFSFQELNFVFEKLRESTSSVTGLRLYYISALMYVTGIRVSQALMLDTDMVFRVPDSNGKGVLVFNCLRLKSTKENQIAPKSIPFDIRFDPGSSLTFIDLHDMYYSANGFNENNGPLFVNASGKRITESAIAKAYSRVFAGTGLRVHPHRFRHACATRVAMSVGVLQASALLDHENLSTTQKYLSLPEPSILAGIIAESFKPRRNL